jgi:hypothetical protein
MLNRFRDRLKRLPVDDELATYDKTSQAGRLRKPTVSELELRDTKRQRRYELYLEAQKLYQENNPVLTIAEKLSISRTTVYKFVTSDTFPERASNKVSPSILDPYVTYLKKRFDFSFR